MKVIDIVCYDVKYYRNIIIKDAIKNKLRYVEMDNEILIETDILYRFEMPKQNNFILKDNINSFFDLPAMIIPSNENVYIKFDKDIDISNNSKIKYQNKKSNKLNTYKVNKKIKNYNTKYMKRG